ncbi:MAG: hypothetical protein KatS3mg020_1051 [Fimbriimonadales bacterium]|nr:MAG: hypothetical protein KatS3mg020_1051 [Fimbriimonadales bacterium]
MAVEWLVGTDARMQAINRQWQAAVRTGDVERARQLSTEIAQRAKITPLNHQFGRADDRRRIVFTYGLMLGLMGHYTLTGGGLIAAIWGNPNPLLVILGLVNLLPIFYTSLVSLFTREQAQGTAIFLRLTRLSGQDLLYGAYSTYVLSAMLRVYLIYITPLLLLMAFAGYESLWAGLWFVGRYGLCLIALGLLWQTLLALLTPVRSTLLTQVIVYALITGAVVAVFILSPIAADRLLRSDASKWFATQPIWLWGIEPWFWATTLLLPLASLVGVNIEHPLWSVPQALLTVATARALAPWAARRLQQVLNATEPEIKPQEGAWW